MLKTVNIQAIARGYAPLMSCVVPDEGRVFVGSDLESAEPSISAQYSQDPLIRYFAFEGEGKKPRYNEDKTVFLCDDPYVALAAVTPMGRPIVEELIREGVEGMAFEDFWVSTSEPGKKCKLKTIRKLAKPWYLGLGYGMGPKTLMKNSAESGNIITLKQARQIHAAYWNMLPKVKAFAVLCEKRMGEKGYIANPFGFRGRPDAHKAFNFQIQSSVNPIIDLLCGFIEAECSKVQDLFVEPIKFFTLIHDEFVYQVRKEDVGLYHECFKKALVTLNKIMNWSVPLRAGFAIADNFYNAKDGLSKEGVQALGVNTDWME